MSRRSARLRSMRDQLSPSSMLPAVALPEELWLGVFRSLDRESENSTLLSLRRVSKTFNRLATPLVFCRLAPIPTPLTPSATESPNKKRRKVKDQTRLTVGPWIARIAEESGLLPLIKEIDFRPRDRRPISDVIDEAVERELLPAHAQLLAMITAPTALSQVLRPCADESWADREAKYRMTTLLLCQAVEEIRFQMTGPDQSTDKLMHHVIRDVTRAHLDARRAAAPAVLPLANVTTVSCAASFGYPVDHDFALQWLSLPRLRSLKLHGLREGKLSELARDVQRSGRIELHFDDSMLGHEGLQHIIAACGGPISLTMRWRAGLWNKRTQWDRIGDLLRQHGNKFDHVLLDATSAWSLYQQGRETPFTFGDLSGTRIRSLGVPYASLVNAASEERPVASLLPPTLKRLTLLGADVADQQRLFGNHLESALPQLTDVRAAPWYRYPFEEWFGQVTYQCVDYNVVPDLGLKRAYSG